MITTKVERFDRGVTDVMQSWIAPASQSQLLSAAAKDLFAQTDAANQAAAGAQSVSHVTTIDGFKTEALDRLNANSVVTRAYDLMPMVLAAIGEMLWEFSPVRTGRYQHSHRLLVDGQEIADVSPGWVVPALPPDAHEIAFVATAPYAGLLEPHDGQPGESRQESDGAYHVVAVLGNAEYAPLASMTFTYISFGGRDEPAIVIVPVH